MVLEMTRKEHMSLLTISVFGSDRAGARDDAGSASYTVSILPNLEKLNSSHVLSKVKVVIQLCLIRRNKTSIKGQQCHGRTEG